MWTEGADIAEIDTLVAAGERAGVDPAEMKAALEDGNYVERALDAVNGARRIGITSTPTIFLGRTRINGWHYYEVLQSVMEQQGVQARVPLPAWAGGAVRERQEANGTMAPPQPETARVRSCTRNYILCGSAIAPFFLLPLVADLL